MAKLTPKQIKAAMSGAKHWKKKGASITRIFQFNDFNDSMKFVNKVARIAERANHHPDIDIRWNKVTLTLATHSEGGLTQKDFDVATKVDPLVHA